MHRRQFIEASLAGTIVAAAAAQGHASTASRAVRTNRGQEVWLTRDTVPADPELFAQKLMAIVAQSDVEPDQELRGGAIAVLEARFASLLGKEACVFLPTGTLANQLAIRVLSEDRARVIVQNESHVYRDESDAAQLLSGINLIPLAPGQASLSLTDVEAAVAQAADGPFPVEVGAISFESPVRRVAGEMIDPAELRAIANFARRRGIRMHLDGARLLLAPPGFDILGCASLFDTVYVSLYKYLDAPSGAILAGPAEDIKKVRHMRHAFGGTIAQGWPCAALAISALKDFRPRYEKAYGAASALFAALEARGMARLKSAANPSNIRFLELRPGLATGLKERMAEAGIQIFKPENDILKIQINHSILNRPTSEYVALFAG